jgi:hypothetical protein
METNENTGRALLAVPPLLSPPRIPVLVRIYGACIIILNAYDIGAQLIKWLVVAATTPEWNQGIFEPNAGYKLFKLILAIVFFCVGLGLWRGKRIAIYFLCAQGIFAGLFGIYSLVSGDLAFALTLSMALFILHIPPIVSAFRHWNAFK